MNKEFEEEIISLYEQGWNPEEIADELGLPETEVMDFCAEYDYLTYSHE